MGTFLGHLLPGAAFAILGMWHLLNTVKSYKLKGASGFRSATWFPFPSPLPWLKHLELYLLLSFSVLAIVTQLVDFPFLALSLQPDSLEHATMYLHLAVYASVALAADLLAPSPPRRDAFADVVAALAASVFGQELFLLRFHSADHAGLEGHYHWLMQLVVAASAAAAAASAVAPRSFVVAVVRSAAVLFQGLWFVVMGFALWVPALVPTGCHGVEGSGDAMRSAVACATEEAARRAVVMANLQFSWALAAVWVVTAYLCLRVDCRGLEYRQLQAPISGVFAGDDGDVTQKRVFPVEEQRASASSSSAGLWHLYSYIRLFLLRPRSYVAPVWFPVRGARHQLELILVAAGALASILTELVVGPARHHPFEDDGTVPANHLHNFEHASISLALAVRLDRARVPRGDAVAQLAAAQELTLTRCSTSTRRTTRAWKVSTTTTCCYRASSPSRSPPRCFGVAAPWSFAVSLVFQGVWFVVMGVMLWTPPLLPKGCFLSHKDGHDVERMCSLYKEEPQYVPLVRGNGHEDDDGEDDDGLEAAKGGSGEVVVGDRTPFDHVER
ncbi:hypothetical protein EJB05_48762, partial [Eragrostis curvula]